LKARLGEIQGQERYAGSEEMKQLQKELQLLIDQENVRWQEQAKTTG
jgi:hypothetical protein